MTAIKSERRYWAYEDISLDLEELIEEMGDEDALQIAPYLSEIRTEYQKDVDGTLAISFAAPDGKRYTARLVAVPSDDDYDDEEDEDEEDDEEFDEDESGYGWAVEIYSAGNTDMLDHEAIFHRPAKGKPIQLQDVASVLVAIAEGVYALSDQDHGSPHAVIGDEPE